MTTSNTNHSPALTTLARAFINRLEEHEQIVHATESLINAQSPLAHGVNQQGVIHYSPAVQSVAWGARDAERRSEQLKQEAYQDFIGHLASKIEDFNAAQTSLTNVVEALRPFGFVPADPGFLAESIRGARARLSKLEKERCYREIDRIVVADECTDVLFANADSGHHVIIRLQGKHGLSVLYYGSSPIECEQGRHFAHDDQGVLIDHQLNQYNLLHTGRVYFRHSESEHIDDSINRLKTATAYLEFCKYLAFKTPFVPPTEISNLRYRKDTVYLARQAARGQDLEIRRQTRTDRYGKRKTQNILTIDKLHIPGGVDVEKTALVDSVLIGIIRVNQL